MQAERARLVRWALVFATVSAATTFPVASAFADDDDEEEEDEDEEEEEEEEDDEADPQPPVTAGGLYTMETYPIAELERPLTITGGMTELRVGIDIDVSAKSAFKKFGLGLDARYGLADNIEGQFHLRTDLNKFSSFVAEAAVEAGIVYDIVDFRLAVLVPYSKTSTTTGTPPVTTETSHTGVDIAFGFPFRYAIKPQIGLIALDTFMTINTTDNCGGCDMPTNSATPDLTPSVGVIVQPVPILAVKLKAKLIVIDFDTEADHFQIPVSLDVQFSPNRKIDIGGEFTFPNLKPADPDGEAGPLEAPKFYDSRFILLYGQLRF